MQSVFEATLRRIAAMAIVGSIVALPQVVHAGPGIAAITPVGDAGNIQSTNRAKALDEKFAALKAAKAEDEAASLATDIWQLWLKSGDGIVDEMMAQAVTAMKIGARDRAKELLEEIIARKPDYAEAWNKRATIRFFEGNYDASLADCVEVLKREPRHFGALVGMGLIAFNQENYQGALAALRRAVDLHPFLKERQFIPLLERKLEGKPL